MITPSFGLTATERVLPRLALDFTTATLDPRVTFTRTGNTATVVNSSGFVAPINADLPRFDFNPTTLACNGLLIEEARTNLFTYSEDFGDSSWVKSNVTVTADATTSPSNVLNADKIVEAATTGSHFFEKVVALTSGTVYTWSGFFKAGERPSVSLIVFTNVNHIATFNLSTGTAVAPSNATSTITNFGNGWYRCSITFTSGATGNGFFDTYINNGSTTSYAGNGTSGIFAWGAQLEVGAFATSYIPTVAASVTRNADVATMTGTNFTSWFNASEGTLYAKADCYTTTPSPTRQTAQLNKVSGAFGNITIKIPRPTGATGLTVITDAGAVAADLGSASITANTPAAAVGTYKLNDFALSGLGAAVATDVLGALPTGIDRLCIGTDFTTTYQNGHIQKIMYWPQRLTNAEVQAFSKG